jgi:DNA (cytosine-5)-methyltransferase 1
MKPFRVFSTFTGIGGFEVGIRNATNRPVEVVGYSEVDKYAIAVYEKHFKGVKNYGDITKINAEELPDFDCLVGGFPCQAFSVAGQRKGFADTRGTLFFDLARILQAKRPGLFVFENVKGLLSHDNGNTFRTILKAIADLGYDCQWQVLNSKNHGVPQNRERIIIVGYFRSQARPQIFPITGADEKDSRAVGDGLTNTLTSTNAGNRNWRGNVVRVGTLRTHNDGRGFRETKSGLAPTIPARARQDGSGQPVIITGSAKYKNGKRSVAYKAQTEAPTIRATQHKAGDNQPMVADTKRAYALTATDYKRTAKEFLNKHKGNYGIIGGRIRRLTPVECERLQAFPDNWTQYAANGTLISDTQRYKMCGNAVTTNVIKAVFEQIFSNDSFIFRH